jgi:hypothetical protein
VQDREKIQATAPASSISITADIYAHAVPRGNQAAADVMETILAGNQAQPRRNQAS